MHEVFEIFAECIKETEKAVLVKLDDPNYPDLREEELWIPKSVIDDDSEVYGEDENSGTLIIKYWFAEKEGLV